MDNDSKRLDFSVTTTARGCAVIEFQDRYGVECSIQKSSLATEDAIWLGPSEPNPKILHGDAKRFGIETKADCGWVSYPLPEEVQCTTRMHLTRTQVAELLPVLRRFADTGELLPPSHEARAALAQPEPEGPSDDDVEAAARMIYGSMRFERLCDTPTWVERGNSLAQDEARECARAVLQRWGRPAAQQSPASSDNLFGVPAVLTHDSADNPVLLPVPDIEPVPEPKGPSDEELLQLAIDTRLYRFQATAGDPIQYEMTEQQVRAYGRAVWARAQAARPAIEPVPVAERLPGVKDCDIKGRCWFIDDDEKWCPVILGDILDEDEPDAIQRIICYYGYTHWIQGWALPVPSSPTNE